MSTYCRITGKSRGLPKPHYFPLLPPISPADARRICRITGKSYGLPTHHFIPVLSAVSRARPKPCHITSKSEGHESHHYAPASVKHVLQKGFRYLAPLLETNAELMTILEGKPLVENNRRFIYTVDENKCTLVLPSRVESAIRDGDIKDIMLSKDSDKILVKLRKGATIELDVKDYRCVDSADELFEGEGPSKEAVLKRKKRKTNDKTDWRRKMFEDKEKQALSEEMRLSEIKSKRIKVKLEAWKQNPVFSSWKSVRAEPSTTAPNDDRFNLQFKNVLQRLDGNQNLNDLLNAPGKPFVNTLPQPTKIESQIVDLSHSLPGIIQQPIVVGDSVTGFPVAKIVSPFQPFVQEIDSSIVNVLKDFNANKPSLHNVLQKQNVIQQKQAACLPSLQNVPDLVKSLRKLFEKGTKNGKNNKFEQGLKIMVGDVEKYVPGQFVKTDHGETFVPGNVVETSTGPTFVPGLVLRTDCGTKFLPGFTFEDEDHSPVFVAGQNALTRHGERFVQGQVLQTSDGARFMPGQTVVTADGIRFVPGQIINDQKCKDGQRFVPGQIVMTPEGPQFVTGYFTQNPFTGEVSFVAGQSILNENCNWEFVPGQNMKMEDGGFVFVAGREVVDDEGQSRFVPGQVVIEEGDAERFVPGITANDESGNIYFVPGMEVETDNGLKFVEGIITSADDGSLAFSAGKVIKNEEETIGFESAKGVDDLIFHDVHSGVTLNPAAVSSAEGTEVFGHLVQSAQGVEFFPGDAAGLPAGKVIPGRLVKGKEMRFIPGTMIEGKFTPGQFVTTDTEEKFIPGQVIETNEGPKFVPGQVLLTRTGPKFVPGQTMETEDGPKFIPGQIIDTKRGPTFIPGQVIFTDEEGSRFVPGQVVDTVEGPRFVPGRVVETGDHVTFIPGQIVETEEGLKFIAPDLEDDPEGGYQFTVQGFEVAPEEIKMIGNSIPHACFIGEMAIDAKTLQQLAEAGMAVGRQLPVDIPSVNIRSLPVTETACRIAHNLDIDASQSVKMSHILSALQQVKQAGVALTPKEIGDDGLEALVYLALESEHDKESYEFLQMLGDALEDTIKMDDDKIAGIDTLHKLSTNLAGKVREKLALVNTVANQLGTKLNMDSAYVQGKVGQILSNLEQIKKSNVFISRKEIKDKNLKMLLNLVSDCDTKLADPDLLRNLAAALENTVQIDPNHGLETIETLCNLTDDLASKARTEALPSIGIAHAVTQNLDLDAASAVKVNHILTNLQEIKKSNITLTKEEIGDENLQILLNLVQMCEGSDEDQITRAVASAFENTIKLNLGHKLDAINKLHELTASVAKKANKKSILVTSAVKDMAKKFNASDENATKLEKLVAGLMKMKHSNESICVNESENNTVKALFSLVQDNKELSDGEFLEVLENHLENIADSHNIDLLQTFTAEVISQTEKKTKLKTEAALSMAGELEMSPEYLVKMVDILSNLNKIKKAGVAINSEEINDGNLEVLLNLATNSDVNKGDAVTMEKLSNALKNTLKIDPQQKLQTVDQLHSLTANLAGQVESKAETINKTAFNMVKKLDIDELESAKIAQILSNLEQIKILDSNLENSSVEDENLRILLKAMTVDVDKSSSKQLLNLASTALEGVLSNGLGNKAETINNLGAMTHTLVNMLQDKSKKVTESACIIAENLNVSTPQLIQISRILTNMQQIKESNAPIPKECMTDGNLELLLTLAMTCNEKPDDPKALEALKNVLEKTIKLDEGNKISTITILDKLTSNVASEALTTSTLINQTANVIAKNLDIGEAQSGQLSQILSNLQQLDLSNIEIEGDSENRELETLLSIAKQCKTAQGNKTFAETVGAGLEELIKQNPECMLETIEKLQKKSAKLVSEDKEKSKLTMATACDIANTLNLGTTHLVQLNHILSDLHEIQKSGIVVPNQAIKNESLELILSLASASRAAKNDEEMMKTQAGVLENVIQIQPEQKIDTIEILHGLTADVTKVTKAMSKSIRQVVAQIAKKFNLEPQSAKLTQILTNAQCIRSSNLSTLKNAANIDENVGEFLDTITKRISETDALKVPKVIASALEKYIQNGLKNGSVDIDALHSVMTDLSNNIENQSLLTAQTALDITNSINLNCPQAVQVSHILSNLQKIQQNNFMVSKKDIPSENLGILMNLALASNERVSDSDIVQALGNALQKTIGNSNSRNTNDMISELHDQITSVATKTQDRMNTFDKTASKMATKLQLDKPYAAKLSQILSNLQEMKISEMNINTLQIKDQNVKSLIQTVFKINLENDDTKFLQVISNVLEDLLKGDLNYKLQNIDLIHTFTCEVISSKRKQTLLNAETAYNLSNKLNLEKAQMVKVNNILTKVHEIQKTGLTLTPHNFDNMKLLLDLSAACKNEDEFEAVNTLADALLKTIALDPKNEIEVVNQLDKLTTDLTKEVKEKVVAQKKITEAVKDYLHLDEEQSIKVEEILFNLQQIKLSHIGASKETIDNKNIGEILKHCLKCDIKKGDIPFLEAVGSILQQEVTPDHLDELHKVTKELASKARDCTLQTALTACSVAKDLNIKTPELVKVGKILSNLHKIKVANIVPTKSNVTGDALEILLSLALAGESTNGSESIESLATALQKTLNINSEDCISTIVDLDQLVKETAMFVEQKNEVLDNISDQVIDKLSMDRIHSAVISDIISNLQQMKLGNINKAEIEKIENEAAKKLIEEALQINTLNGDQTHLKNIGQVLENIITTLDADTKFQVIGTLHNVTNKLAAQVQEKSKFTTEMAIGVSNMLNLTGSKPVAQVSHILTNLQQVEQSNFVVPESANIQNENVELLINLALACNDQEGMSDAVIKMAGALQKTLELNPEAALHTLEILNDSTNDIALKIDAEDALIHQMGCQMAENLNVPESHSRKLSKILSNLQRLRSSKVPVDVLHDVEDPYLRSLLEATTDLSPNIYQEDIRRLAKEALENIIGINSEKKLPIISTLENLTDDLVSKVNKTVLTTTEMAYEIANGINGSAPQLMKMSHILSNLQQLKKVDFMPESHCADENLELLMNLALTSIDEKNEPSVLKNLTKALEKTVKTENGASSIDTLHKITTELALQAKEKSEILDDISAKIVENCTLDKVQTKKLKAILMDVQRIKHSKVDLKKENITDEGLEGLLINILDASTETDMYQDSVQAVGTVLEKFLLSSDHKKKDIDSIHATISNIASKARERKILMTETAYTVGQELHMNTPQLVKVSHILSNLCDIKQSHMANPISTFADDNLDLLLTLSLPCDATKTDDQTVNSLASILKNTINIDPEQKGKIVDSLQMLTADLAQNTKIKSKLIEEKAVEMAQNLNVGQAYSMKLCDILSSLQQIKSAKFDIVKHNIKNENWKALINSILQMADNLEDAKFYEFLGSEVEKVIRVDPEHKLQNINSLHAVLNGIITKENNKMYLIAQTAYNMAKDLKVNTPDLMKISHILSDLQELNQANVAISQDDIKDDKMQVLLNLSLNGDVKKSDVETMENLSKALLNTIQTNGKENELIIDTLHAQTAEISSKAQEKYMEIERVAHKLITKLGMDVSKAAKLGSILSILEQLASSSLDIEKENIRNTEIRKVLNNVIQKGDQINLELLAGMVENFLKEDLEHQSCNLDELYGCVYNLNAKVKNKSLLLTDNALQVANNLNLGIEGTIKIAKILSNVQKIKEADITLPLTGVEINNLKLLLNLAQQEGNITCDSNYVEKLRTVLESTVKMNVDHKEQTVEELFALTADAASKMTQRAQVFKKYGLQLGDKLNVDHETALKLTSLLSSLQCITQTNFNIGQTIENADLNTLLKLSKECANEQDENFVKIVGNGLEKILKANIDHKVDNINTLHKMVSDLATTLGQNTLQAARTSQAVASNLKLDAFEAVQMSDVLLNLQHVCQMNVPLAVNDIQNEDVKLIVNLALSSNADCDKPFELVPTLGKALEKLMELRPEIKSETIKLLHSTTANLAKEADQVSTLINNAAAKLAKNFKIDRPSMQKLNSIFTNLLNISQANIELPREYVEQEHLEELLSVIKEMKNDAGNAMLIEKIANTLGNTLKFNVEHKDQIINTLEASIADLTTNVKNKSVSQTSIACQLANRLDINESCAIHINEVLTDLKQLKQMQGFVSNIDIEDKDLKLIFNHILACEGDTENTALLETLANAIEHTVKAEKSDKSENINKLQSVTAQLVSVAQSRSAIIEKTASKLAAKLKVDPKKLSKIFSNLQQIRRSSVFTSMEDIPDKNVHELLNFALENDDLDDVKFFKAVGDVLEKIIKANIQQKSQTVDSLCAITTDLASGVWDRALTVAETAHNVANSINADASSINVSHILSNLQQIKLSNIPVSGDTVQDEDLKLLLNLASAYDGDADSSDFVQALGQVLKNTVNLKPDKAIETLAKFHTLTGDLLTEVGNQSNAVKEVATKVANNLKVENSTISDIILNLKEIQLYNMASVDSTQNEDLKYLLNLASECGYDYEDVEFLQTLGDAIENIIEIDLDHKSQKIDTLHALTTQLASAGRQKALLITSMACKMVDKLNLDPSHSVTISRILSNLQEISESGFIVPSSDVKDKNLELLLNQIRNAEANKEECEFLSELGQTLEKLIAADPKRKLEIVHTLQTLSSDILTVIREKPPSKVQLLRSLIKNNLELKDDVVEKLSSILDTNEMAMCVAFRNMSRENPDFVGKVLRNAATILNDKRIDEKRAVETLHRAIVKAVGETSEHEVAQVLRRNEGEDIRSLVVDASGLAKALGMNEVVHVLDVILSDSRSMPMLAKDKIVMEVLKRLTVMRQLAEKQPTLRAALHDLQYDPYAARNDPRLRALVRDSAVLMVIPEESLVLRSSADIPSSLLFGDNTLAVEDFMVKSRQTGKTFLILKKGVQMVVPREAARDVLTGKVPYTVLDENGIHHFTPLHVFNALKLPRIATNRFSNYGYSPKMSQQSKAKGEASEKELLFSRCGSATTVDDSPPHNKTFPNGSCSTQEVIERMNNERMN